MGTKTAQPMDRAMRDTTPAPAGADAQVARYHAELDSAMKRLSTRAALSLALHGEVRP